MKLTQHQRLLLIDFMAYCTTREEVATLSDKHESQIGLTLVAEYEQAIADNYHNDLESYIDDYYLN